VVLNKIDLLKREKKDALIEKMTKKLSKTLEIRVVSYYICELIETTESTVLLLFCNFVPRKSDDAMAKT